MKPLALILTACFLSCLIFLSCKKDESEKEPDKPEIEIINLTPTQKNLVQSGNSFSINILNAVIQSEQPGENIMISPLSISLALAMTANGAKNNTLDEMLNTLGFENFEMQDFNEYFRILIKTLLSLDNKVNLSIANSIWYRDTFSVLQSFLDVNQQYYNAEISELDFNSPQAVDIINNWVANATNQKIEEIIDEIDLNVVMYLINAIYFYGQWHFEFDESATENKSFFLSGGTEISVPMMKQEADLKYFTDGDNRMVQLPYGRGNFVMNIIIPQVGKSPADLVNSLTTGTWNNWTNGLFETEVQVIMPKFQFEYEKKLIPVLESLGMIDLFIEGIADLTGINELGKLFVSDVVHKTYIDVNEKGTEAAAVTSVEVQLESIEDGPVFFYVNRPFVFLIREVSTGCILFAGVVENPE